MFKKIKSYIYREKIILLIIFIITVLIFGLALVITNINNDGDSDTVFWLETIIIGFLINLICSLVIIAFFDDRAKKDSIAKKNFFLKKVTSRLTKVANVFVSIHNKLLISPLNTDNEKRTFILETSLATMQSTFQKLDFSRQDAPIQEYHLSRQNTTANWLEYYLDTCILSMKYIDAFKEILIQYISEEFYECIDDFTDLELVIHSFKYKDLAVVNKSDYSANIIENNKKLESLVFLPTIMENIRRIAAYLKKEADKNICLFD